MDMLLKALKYFLITLATASIILFFYQSIRNHNYYGGNDLTTYLMVSRWFFEGDNPYILIARRYIYPLFLLIICYPLSFLQSNFTQKIIAATIWSLASYMALFLTLAASRKALYKFKSWWLALKNNLLPAALIIIMMHPFLQDEFLNGQVNLLVLGCIAAFFFFLEKNRQFRAALFLAAAASIKIAPGLCLVYALLTRQYRTVIYCIFLILIFNIGLPVLINPDSLEYYRYFSHNVMPKLAASEAAVGFKSFSLISTVSYIFNIHWSTIMNMLAMGILAIVLLIPIILFMPRKLRDVNFFYRFTVFGAIIAVLPLTFPMSEPHHLLLQTIPFLVILAYWRYVIQGSANFFRDKLSLLFLISVIGFQVGHGMKQTPIRFLSILAVYIGLVLLLRKHGSHKIIFQK
jgi:hypothetical protein